jgi:uncharacterized protein (DUF2336 family)
MSAKFSCRFELPVCAKRRAYPVTASDFQGIAFGSDASKAERLFRASVSAFCTLTRPSRREITQLEDLTLPLYDAVSVEARRYVAAALSECAEAPAKLVERLTNDRVEVAAPLLARSAMLTDVDLIALIGKHGLPHARAIARRAELNPTIMQLIRALEAIAPQPPPRGTAAPSPQPGKRPSKRSGSRRMRNAPSVLEAIAAATERAASMASLETPSPFGEAIANTESTMLTSPGNADAAVRAPALVIEPPAAAQFSDSSIPTLEADKPAPVRHAEEAARDRLRSMMQPGTQQTGIARRAENRTFAKLRDAAFTGNTSAFQTALVETLGLTPATVSKITDTSSYSPLLAALRSLYLGEEQIFMIAASVFPARFAHPESIRLFAERCRSLSQEVAAERVRSWKMEALANQMQWEDARMKRA